MIDESPGTASSRPYREWILQVAELSRDADAFVVGTELDLHDAIMRPSGDGNHRRRPRETLDMPLTYSASWNHYRRTFPFGTRST